ncbi:MAG: hypothetical protein NDI61_08975 [Bdellovibrionaceae bacterium]|nr:hypothetical protein [Pseudobdellovibrionaceae bacterium]
MAENLTRTQNHVLVKWLLGLLAALFVMAGLMGWYRYYLGDHNRDQIQKGARADLDLILKAERAFKSQFGFYTTDLVLLGIEPKYVFYKIGFLKPLDISAVAQPPEKHDPTRMNLDLVKKTKPQARIAYSPQTRLETIDFSTLASLCTDCTATGTTFRAIAVANLDEDPELDVWTVDQEGTFQQLADDLQTHVVPQDK